MSFRDSVEADIKKVFLNRDEFAVRRTVKYDKKRYRDIPIVLTGIKEKDRRLIISDHDHAEGLYLVTAVLHCAVKDLGGCQPKKGLFLKINDRAGGRGFYREFRVASSVVEAGMLRAELEEIGE